MAQAAQLTGNPAENELPYNPDDDRLALAIAAEWENKKAYFHSEWHEYTEGCWRKRDLPEIRRGVRLFLRGKRGILPKGVSQGRINALTAMLEDDCFISDRRIIAMQQEYARYIPLQNGLFNLETFQLEPHKPELYFTTQLSFPYDEDADCPTFRRYLRSSLVGENEKPDERMIELVQEALAYSMTDRTDMKASFWLVGKPDSGKSTLIAFIRALMGSLHATIDLNQLAANRFMLSEIVGKRVVTFTEADSNHFIPDALYKAMVGGQDEIYVDVKNKPGIAFVPAAKFWWAMNNAPRFNDRSGATVNRLRVILFDRTVPQSERIGNLGELLERERAGVFNWLLYGYQRLNRRGDFTRPDRSERWQEDYKLENDTERAFSLDRLDFDPAFTIMTGDLYDEYREWCLRYGYKPKNQQQVAKEWRRLGLVDKGYQGLIRWHGARRKSVV